MGNLVSNMMPAKGKGRPAITEGDAAALVSSAPERGTTGVATRNKQGRNNARSGAGGGGGGGNAPMAVASAANSSMQSVGDTSVERQSSEMNYDSNSSSMSDAMLNYEGPQKHPQHFSLDNVQFTENRRPVLAQHRTAPPTPRAKSPEFHPRAHSPMKHMQGNCCKHGHANRRFYDPSKMSFAQLKAVRTKQRIEFARNADRNRMMHMCHNHNHNHHQLQVQQQQPQQSQPPNQQQHNQLIRSASKYVMDQEPQQNAEAVGNKSSATPATVAPPQSTLKSVTARKQPASAATALQKANAKKSTIIKQTEFKPTKATTRSAAKVKAKKILEACQEDLKEHVRVPAKKVKNCVSPRKSPRQMKKTSGVKAAATAAKQKGSKAATPRGTKEEVAKPESAAKVMENLYNSYSNTQQQQQQQQQPALKQQKNPQQLQQQQYHPQLYKPPSYTDFSQYQAQLLRREHESDDLQNILNKQDASSSATDSFESSSSSSVPMSELLLRLDCKSRQKKEKAQARAAKKKAAKAAERMAAAKAAAEEAYKAQCEIENQEQIKQQQQERNKEGSMISSGDSSSTSISLTEILSKIEGGSIERGGDIDERQQTIRQNTKHDIDNDDYNQIPAKPSMGNASAKSTSIATESDIFDGDDEIIDVQDNASSTYGGD